MGIGRRTFLKIFSAAIASVASQPFRSFAIDSDLYVNHKLGFACRKPPDWDFAFTFEFGKLVSGPYVDELDQRTMQDIANYAGPGTDGMLVISSEKISSRDKHIAPMIQVLVDYNPTLSDILLDLDAAQHYADGFRDAVVQQQEHTPAQLLQVSNCDAIRFNFGLVHRQDRQVFEWDVDQLTVFQGPLTYAVTMLNPMRAKRKFVYDEFIQSIRIA